MNAPIRIVTAGLAAVLALPLVPARAQGVAVVTTEAFEFFPGDVKQPNAPLQILHGSTLVYVNLDPIGSHTVTADRKNKRGRPLFDSGDPVGMGQYAIVKGTERLRPGRYPFHCALHTHQMHGVLTVLPIPG
jgi:plastocyanin